MIKNEILENDLPEGLIVWLLQSKKSSLGLDSMTENFEGKTTKWLLSKRPMIWWEEVYLKIIVYKLQCQFFGSVWNVVAINKSYKSSISS